MGCGVNPNLKTDFPCSYTHFHAPPIDPPAQGFSPIDMGSRHFYKDLRPLSIELCIAQTSTRQQKQNSGYKKVFSNLNLFVTCKTFATFSSLTLSFNGGTKVGKSDHRTKKVMPSGSNKFAEIKCGINNKNETGNIWAGAQKSSI